MDLSPVAIARSIASMQSEVLGSLFGKSSDNNSDMFSSILAQRIGGSNGGGPASALSSEGGTPGLFDPRSAYNMMSLINNRDTLYKAQYSELSHMQDGVGQMQAAGQNLCNINAATSADQIMDKLQQFVAQYNNWRVTFGPDIKPGGLLANTQAAQVSLYELEQSIKNIFNGAKNGVHGLGDLGISIDSDSRLARLDVNRLSAVLGSNHQGAVGAINEFSANFAKSAGLLNSENNFIPNQLDNLGRAIHYIADNKGALTREFGTGDPANPTGKVAQALAAYNQTYS